MRISPANIGELIRKSAVARLLATGIFQTVAAQQRLHVRIVRDGVERIPKNTSMSILPSAISAPTC